MEKQFIDINELSEYLSVSKNTIYWWITTKQIPYNKLGRLVRFNLGQVNSWLQDNNHEANN